MKGKCVHTGNIIFTTDNHPISTKQIQRNSMDVNRHQNTESSQKPETNIY